MFSFQGLPEKQIFMGNIFFIGCCLFYLAWWLLAFKPVGAITGAKSGWLLLPAAVSGIAGVAMIVNGITQKTLSNQLIPFEFIAWGGIVLFIVLLIVTGMVFDRPVTTELILIVGWGVLTLAEINALFGLGILSRNISISILIILVLALIVSLVCYTIYYNLDRNAGYLVGMIPLLLAALIMIVISCAMIFSKN